MYVFYDAGGGNYAVFETEKELNNFRRGWINQYIKEFDCTPSEGDYYTTKAPLNPNLKKWWYNGYDD